MRKNVLIKLHFDSEAHKPDRTKLKSLSEIHLKK
jgi:hypothetical protein